MLGAGASCSDLSILLARVVQITDYLHVQGEHSDVMFIVESGVITCHVDYLRLHHRMRLPVLSQDVLAVAPGRYSLLRSCIIATNAGLQPAC